MKKFVLLLLLLIPFTALSQVKTPSKYEEQFSQCVRLGDLTNMEKIWKKRNIDLNAFPYLSYVAGSGSYQNNLEMVKWLLDKGANVNGTNFASPPIIEAITSQQWEIVKELIVYGADVNIEDDYGRTPGSLLLSQDCNNKAKIEIMKILIDNGLDFKTTVPDLNASQRFNKVDGMSVAIIENAVEMVHLLLERSAGFYISSSKYLNEAMSFRKFEIAKDYIKYGAKPDDSSSTVLYELCSLPYDSSLVNSQIEFIKILLKNGLNPNAYTYSIGNSWDSLLLTACNGRFYKLAKELIEYGANVNIQGHGGETPLMYAVRNGQEDLIKMIVDKGADLSVLNSYKKTALDIAKERGDANIINLLQSTN
jgi:ankyrin repeat protein